MKQDDPQPLSAEKMTLWNKFVDHLKAKGYAGKSELDHNVALRQKVFAEYNAANPKDMVTEDMVLPVQKEIQDYKNKILQSLSKGGNVAFDKGTTPENFMKGISQVDGVLGQKTSSWQFPNAYLLDKQKNTKTVIGLAPKVDIISALRKP